ncbi:MAG: hypothetical protein WCI02_05950 [Planctomycetota bacterium]
MWFACGLPLAWADDLEEILARAESSLLAQSPPANQASIEEWRQTAHLLGLVDALEPAGRQRFILPLAASRSKPRVLALRETLESLDVLSDIERVVDRRRMDLESSSLPPAELGGSGLSIRELQREGLRAMLNGTPAVRPELSRRHPWDDLKFSRATKSFALVTWGPGSYSIAKTPHFTISSQSDEKSTLEMAEGCEIAYALWKALFVDEVSQSPPTGSTPTDSNQTNDRSFQVVLFRSRDAYLRTLRAIEPRITASTGYYSPQHRISFFYWDRSKSFATLVHELTHQFFQESEGWTSSFDADKDPGYWAIEGIALYMESMSIRSIGGACVIDIGGWDSPRLQAGRFRRLHDEYWIPWEEFSQADGTRFRREPEIAAWYSQACGLAHLWMDGSPQERVQFREYLKRVYQGDGKAAAKVLGDDDQVREAYDRYLQQSWQLELRNATSRPFFPNRIDAVLSRCGVASEWLLAWDLGFRKSSWLDLSHTQVDDALFAPEVQPAWEINRLNLESTRVTDASMTVIASMKTLEELDLSQCAVSDDGIQALANHPALRQLWLSNTQITDASLKTLATIPKLERVAIDGTAITDQGWQALKKRKPNLKR